jgi:hypothetical protein
MEKVINQLYEMEEKANIIINRVPEEKKLLYDQLNKNMEMFDIQISKDTQDKLHVLQDKLDTEVQKEYQVLLSTNEQYLKDLESNFQNNYNTLVDKVFHNIIGE